MTSSHRATRDLDTQSVRSTGAVERPLVFVGVGAAARKVSAIHDRLD